MSGVIDVSELLREERDRQELLAAIHRTIDDATAPRGAPPVRELAKRLLATVGPLAAEPAVRRPLRVRDVLREMREHGPLVHEPTGFPTIDESTGGGPVYGSRWYVLGAPDAAKTALLVQLAHTWAERGVTVGMLAVDEEGPDIVGRLAQRIGFGRGATERREPGDLDRMERELGELPIRIYDASWTIEAAARDLAAASSGGRAALIVDSVQTVACDAVAAAEREMSEVQAIGRNVAALRAMATEHRLIVVATSEMSRGAYRAIKAADKTSALAAGKWSGTIEYSARVMLALATAESDDTTDVVSVEIPKNKHGRRRYADRGEAIYLRLHKPSQTLEECDPPESAAEKSAEDRSAAREEQVEAMAERIYAALLRANAHGRRLTSRDDLRALVKGPNDLKTRAVSLLIASGRIEGGRGRPFAPCVTDGELEVCELVRDESGVLRRAGALEVAERSEAQGAAADAQVDAMCERILAALARANAAGRRITSQRELKELVSGRGAIKQQAISRLIAHGRIVGGRGAPFASAYDEGD